MATILILLSGVCYSDELEELQDATETATHRDLFTQVDQDLLISDDLPGVPTSTQSATIPVFADHFTQGSTYSILRVSAPTAPSSGNKLFQLLSTYLIWFFYLISIYIPIHRYCLVRPVSFL